MRNRWELTAIKLGMFSSVCSMLFWVIFIFFNPTHRIETDVLINTFLMLFAPACLALFASIKKKPALMYLVFIWSLPISLYLALYPSIILKMFSLTAFLYLLSGIIMSISAKKSTG
ncbi:hypothetical protein SAMN05660649_01520 [Desulfotomaculum arcticum]|uniref:Uncharacterized protein n=1 Tax=Desulfotruncus arcticus DSM 17038 TaxID=1121424 RepID=A0A1I2RJE4_9FIRM|nr:hypothetical protein [Desulfotruncus arcticus]SFG38747.1 hypothetical protein SAMN05660649_01520 [Desulfotomaculum arcticum] [Desulfotruncus arcticus DSM 17038]